MKITDTSKYASVSVSTKELDALPDQYRTHYEQGRGCYFDLVTYQEDTACGDEAKNDTVEAVIEELGNGYGLIEFWI